MWVSGSSTATRGPPGHARPSVTWPLKSLRARGRSQRRPSSFATSKPMLWRVAA